MLHYGGSAAALLGEVEGIQGWGGDKTTEISPYSLRDDRC